MGLCHYFFKLERSRLDDLFQCLRYVVRTGDVNLLERHVSLRELEDELGVEVAVVSRALHPRPELIVGHVLDQLGAAATQSFDPDKVFYRNPSAARRLWQSAIWNPGCIPEPFRGEGYEALDHEQAGQLGRLADELARAHEDNADVAAALRGLAALCDECSETDCLVMTMS